MTTRAIYNEDDVKRMAYLYEECGWTHKEIAKEFACQRSTVGRYLSLAGVPARPRKVRNGHPKIPSEEIRRVAFMYERLWMTHAEIAEVMGYRYQSAVGYRLQLAGIKSRPKHGSWKQRQRERTERLARLNRLMDREAA